MLMISWFLRTRNISEQLQIFHTWHILIVVSCEGEENNCVIFVYIKTVWRSDGVLQRYIPRKMRGTVNICICSSYATRSYKWIFVTAHYQSQKYMFNRYAQRGREIILRNTGTKQTYWTPWSKKKRKMIRSSKHGESWCFWRCNLKRTICILSYGENSRLVRTVPTQLNISSWFRPLNN